MWVYATITIYNGQNEIDHKFEAKTRIDDTEDVYEAMEDATRLWLYLFKDFGKFVEVDDVYA